MSKSDINDSLENLFKEFSLSDIVKSIEEQVSTTGSMSLETSDDKVELKELVELFPDSLMAGPVVGSPVFIFRDDSGNRSFPVRLNSHSASIVSLGLGSNGSGVYNIVIELLDKMGAELQSLIFTKLVNRKLKGRLEFLRNDNFYYLDGAIEELLPLALEAKTEFFVSEKVYYEVRELQLDAGSHEANLANEIIHTQGNKDLLN
ncbi:MAG: hypothetical protein AB8E15_00280 [Bdellovibrionales bacterium]